ncbi:MAG: secretin and TonB N-terminal domain-containing protein [Candidatus Omnitrophica bacterium]|nr:secretin and TonB N-terminal domain-containing protein [Candidatus Omnitrophota bacterium]
MLKVKKGFCAVLLSVFFLYAYSFTNVFSAEKLISIEAEHADIVSVLKSIAEQTNINLVVSDGISGTVSLVLRDVSLDAALKAVLKANNYFYERSGDIINVYSYENIQQEERFAKTTTRVYSLKHASVSDLRRALLSIKSPRGRVEINEKANQIIVTDTLEKISEIEVAVQCLDLEVILKKYRLIFAQAADIKTKLQQVIPAEKGEIFTDERTNSVVIRATPIILENVDELIRGWDVQRKQVLIEAKILQVTLDKNIKRGIDWEYLKGKYDLKGSFAQDLTTGGIFQVGMLSRRNYQSVLEMLESSSDTDVLSAPRIVVMDGKEASILVGSSEPYPVQQKDVDTGLITTETKFLDVGIKLIVTPTITESGFVIMKIHPEVSSARRVPEVDNALAVDTTQADTTLMVKDSDTVILGGLIKDSNKTTVNKVPLLGDIPLLGLFFRNDVKEKVKQELVVFITPHIIEIDKESAVIKAEAKRIEELTKRSLILRQKINVAIEQE